MLYKVTIKKKIGASLACRIQTIWVDADDLKPDDPYLEDRLIGIISLNEDKLTDKCIYDVTLKDSPDIQTVEILPVSKKPYWMSDKEKISDEPQLGDTNTKPTNDTENNETKTVTGKTIRCLYYGGKIFIMYPSVDNPNPIMSLPMPSEYRYIIEGAYNMNIKQ